MGKSNNTEDEMRTERLGRELVCRGAILDYCHDKVKMPKEAGIPRNIATKNVVS